MNSWAFDLLILFVMSAIPKHHEYEKKIKHSPNSTIQLALKVKSENKPPKLLHPNATLKERIYFQWLDPLPNKSYI